MKNLINWFLTDKKPAFYDCESGTSIEQTARVYKAMQELITEYNSWVEKSNKIIADFTASATKNQEVFETALRQEFQDFINVVDLKVLELEQYVKVNLSTEIRKLWDEMAETGEIQEMFNKTLETIVNTVNEQNANIEQFKTDTNADIEQFKTDVNTTLNSYTDNMHDWVNEESEPAKLVLNKGKTIYYTGEHIANGTLETQIDLSVIKDYTLVMVNCNAILTICFVTHSIEGGQFKINGVGNSSFSSPDIVSQGCVNLKGTINENGEYLLTENNSAIVKNDNGTITNSSALILGIYGII